MKPRNNETIPLLPRKNYGTERKVENVRQLILTQVLKTDLHEWPFGSTDDQLTQIVRELKLDEPHYRILKGKKISLHLAKEIQAGQRLPREMELHSEQKKDEIPQRTIGLIDILGNTGGVVLGSFSAGFWTAGRLVSLEIPTNPTTHSNTNDAKPESKSAP